MQSFLCGLLNGSSLIIYAVAGFTLFQGSTGLSVVVDGCVSGRTGGAVRRDAAHTAESATSRLAATISALEGVTVAPFALKFLAVLVALGRIFRYWILWVEVFICPSAESRAALWTTPESKLLAVLLVLGRIFRYWMVWADVFIGPCAESRAALWATLDSGITVASAPHTAMGVLAVAASSPFGRQLCGLCCFCIHRHRYSEFPVHVSSLFSV